MSRKISADMRSSKTKVLAIGVLISLLVSFAMLFLCAFILTVGDFAKGIAFPMSSVCFGIGSLIGSRYAAKRIGEKGYVCGFVVGICVFLLCMIMGMIISGSSFTFMTVIRMVIILLMATLGGILGINTGSTKSLVK